MIHHSGTYEVLWSANNCIGIIITNSIYNIRLILKHDFKNTKPAKCESDIEGVRKKVNLGHKNQNENLK